jgi:hypothetical protein
MPITASSLYRDSLYFMRNQLGSIVLLSLVAALITVILNQVLTPGNDQINLLNSATDNLAAGGMNIVEFVRQMDLDQQRVLLKFLLASFVSDLLGSTLLVGSILTLIQLVSASVKTSALRVIGISTPLLPRLFLLLLLCTFLMQLGFTLLIVPGILVAIGVCMAPILCTTQRIGIFHALTASFRVTFGHLRLVAPAIIACLIAKIIVIMFVSRLSFLSLMSMTIILNALSNLIVAFLLVYLFRLYMKLSSPPQVS